MRAVQPYLSLCFISAVPSSYLRISDAIKTLTGCRQQKILPATCIRTRDCQRLCDGICRHTESTNVANRWQLNCVLTALETHRAYAFLPKRIYGFSTCLVLLINKILSFVSTSAAQSTRNSRIVRNQSRRWLSLGISTQKTKCGFTIVSYITFTNGCMQLLFFSTHIAFDAWNWWTLLRNSKSKTYHFSGRVYK